MISAYTHAGNTEVADVDDAATLWTCVFSYTFTQTLCWPAVFTQFKLFQIGNNHTEELSQLIHIFSKQKTSCSPLDFT